MIGYGFHPETSIDHGNIWEFIPAGNLQAANRVTEETLAAIDDLVEFPMTAMDGQA